MAINIFIPLTDEILYGHPELLSNGLVPYRTDVPCLHWLKEAEVEIEYEDGHREYVNAPLRESLTEHAA
ncbi:MAG: hypothetical protein ACN4GR_12315 [Arenicellales bacterium]